MLSLDKSNNLQIPLRQIFFFVFSFQKLFQTIIKLLETTNFECLHQTCPPNCYAKRSKSCRSLIQAVLRVHKNSTDCQNNLKKERKPDEADGKMSSTREALSSSAKLRKASQISNSSQRISYLNSLLTSTIFLTSSNQNTTNLLLKNMPRNPTVDYVNNQVQCRFLVCLLIPPNYKQRLFSLL